jgi:hypothetical protein
MHLESWLLETEEVGGLLEHNSLCNIARFWLKTNKHHQ